jgi:putative membrane protein
MKYSRVVKRIIFGHNTKLHVSILTYKLKTFITLTIMFRSLVYLVGNSIMLLILSSLLGNFEIQSIGNAAIFVVVLTILNWTVVPIIKFFTFPINLLTLGLFYAILNVIVILLLARNLPGIQLAGDGFTQFITAVVISVSMSVVQTLIGKRF